MPSGTFSQWQVYPRVGGGTMSGKIDSQASQGLSPRGRGNPLAGLPLAALLGSIPAWAGEPRLRARLVFRCWVYPRVGGGTSIVAQRRPRGQGLSPRGRGNPIRLVSAHVEEGSIPAWAGEPERRIGTWTKCRVYPRVGGGTNSAPGEGNRFLGLSPRGRGNRRYCFRPTPRSGSIPAWAGEPPKSNIGHIL